MAVASPTRASALISKKEIQQFVDQVAQHFKPSRVILFGSYACGQPNPDSDVDLLVRSPAEVCPRRETGDTYIREISAKGIVMYEGDNTRVGWDS